VTVTVQVRDAQPVWKIPNSKVARKCRECSIAIAMGEPQEAKGIGEDEIRLPILISIKNRTGYELPLNWSLHRLACGKGSISVIDKHLKGDFRDSAIG
jgi:hypothetical protein